MLRTEVTVGGCCRAVETTIRRSLSYEVNAKILCFCGQRSHPQVFCWPLAAATAPPIMLATSRQPQAQFLTQLRDWHFVDKMPPQDGYFFFWSEMLPFLPHTFAPLS